MIQRDNSNSLTSKLLKTRRVALLASVAGVGFAALVSGTSLHHPIPFTGISPAAAAETLAQPSGFADLVARVKPAVISVRVRLNGSARVSSLNQDDDNAIPFRQGSPLDRFLRQFGLPNDTQQMPRNGAGEGSGFFISADGYAVTNNHVVEHAKTVEVVTDDDRILTAKVIGTDPKTDLALIKVDGNAFPFVKFADHDPRIGDWDWRRGGSSPSTLPAELSGRRCSDWAATCSASAYIASPGRPAGPFSQWRSSSVLCCGAATRTMRKACWPRRSLRWRGNSGAERSGLPALFSAFSATGAGHHRQALFGLLF
jgi:Trypsin-like peptidase domain